MSTSKGKRQKGANQTSLPKLSTPANVERVLQLLTDRKQTREGRDELEEWLDELFSDTGTSATTIETAGLQLAKAARIDERGKPSLAYRMVQDILRRTAGGETLDEFARRRDKAMRERVEEVKRE